MIPARFPLQDAGVQSWYNPAQTQRSPKSSLETALTITSAGKTSGKRHGGDMFRPIASSLHLPSDHVALIDDSHDRCAALGLSRFESPDLSPISMSELAVLRERNQRLHAHASPVMEMLFEQIVQTQSMVVLCDATGTVLRAIGDDDFLVKANKVALQPGANWSESSKGTNGIGTALIAEEPTLVHADEHFVHANHFLTCSAAPILDPRGNVLGVLDVSGDQRSYHQHTMALVKMSARMIENHWLSDDYRHVMRLHFHNRVDFIGTLKEGILAVTADGRIAGANRSALDQLGQSGAALRMQALPALLGVTVAQLVDHFRSPLAKPLVVRTADGHAMHLLARFDWPVWHTIAEAADAPAPTQPGAAAGAVSSLATAAPEVERATAADVQRASAVRAEPPAARTEVARDPWEPWVTSDAVMSALIDKLKRVVDHQVAIVLHGEVGTGKESLARAMHQASRRRVGPFVSLRCGAVAASTLAAELFGDSRGPGKIAQAQGGTLFLSEIVDMPREIQARLLHLLQDGELSLPGLRHTQPINFDLITASRLEPRELRERMAADRAGEALYYRLNGLTLRLPALRERSDVLALAQRFLANEASGAAEAGADGRSSAAAGARSKPHGMALSPQVEALLQGCAWPGNVRQLVNVLRAARIMALGPVIELEHLPEDFVESCNCLAVAAAPAGATPLQSLDAMEVEAIEAALRVCGGNISEASKRLGISRNTIYRRLRWKDQRPK